MKTLIAALALLFLAAGPVHAAGSCCAENMPCCNTGRDCCDND